MFESCGKTYVIQGWYSGIGATNMIVEDAID